MTANDSSRIEDRPCQEEEANQFDFWLGRWRVRWNETKSGTNHVQKILGGCVIREQFDGRPGTELQGLSVSRFNPELGFWQQTWVDNAGNYLDFIGGWQNDRMVLSRKVPGSEGQIQQRMVWYDIMPDTLSWNWERSEDKGKTWNLLWKFHYEREFEEDRGV